MYMYIHYYHEVEKKGSKNTYKIDKIILYQMEKVFIFC